MKSSRNLSGLLLLSILGYIHPTNADTFEVTLPVSGRTSFVESDSAAVYYPKKEKYSPIFVGNDGSAETGGFRVWELYGKPNSSLEEVGAYKTGRSKLVEILYGVEEDEDFVVTLSMSDGLLRVFEIGKNGVGDVKAEKFVRGDFSAMCTWRSGVGKYVYVLGKRWGYRYLVREWGKGKKKGVEVVEVRMSTILEKNGADLRVEYCRHKNLEFLSNRIRVPSLPMEQSSSQVIVERYFPS